nr:sigma-70 family RNA polymerase sigma factor [Luteitalea pratensis]
MNGRYSPTVTQLLVAWNGGDREALEQLLPLVYAELKRLARGQLSRERRATLQPTALVHEAFVKLVDQRVVDWQNRAHFFGIAACLMRRIVLQRARHIRAGKRGGGALHVAIDDATVLSDERSAELVALDAAMVKLAAMDPRQGRIVELRFFGGLSVEETGEVLGISAGTVKREWRSARAWLYKEIARGWPQ